MDNILELNRVEKVRKNETNRVRLASHQAACNRARTIPKRLDGAQDLLPGLVGDRTRPIIDDIGNRRGGNTSQPSNVITCDSSLHQRPPVAIVYACSLLE